MFSELELSEIASEVARQFDRCLRQYDYSKYPVDRYEQFKKAFSTLKTPNPEIFDAMVWKWGHWGKPNFPEAHKLLIKEIELKWPAFSDSIDGHIPQSTFHYWKRALERNTRYITTAFITHLVHFNDVPIIDQHNYRAMNGLIWQVRPTHLWKRVPSNWDDIIKLKSFLSQIQESTGHTESELDKFLMMYGAENKGYLETVRRNR